MGELSLACNPVLTQVLAVFPDTTSFYRATISKQPVRKGGTVSEVRSEWSLYGFGYL